VCEGKSGQYQSRYGKSDSEERECSSPRTDLPRRHKLIISPPMEIQPPVVVKTGEVPVAYRGLDGGGRASGTRCRACPGSAGVDRPEPTGSSDTDPPAPAVLALLSRPALGTFVRLAVSGQQARLLSDHGLGNRSTLPCVTMTRDARRTTACRWIALVTWSPGGRCHPRCHSDGVVVWGVRHRYSGKLYRTLCRAASGVRQPTGDSVVIGEGTVVGASRRTPRPALGPSRGMDWEGASRLGRFRKRRRGSPVSAIVCGWRSL